MNIARYATAALLISMFGAAATPCLGAATNCAQMTKDLASQSSLISDAVFSYWDHRKKFVALKSGNLRHEVDADSKAEKEKADSAPVKSSVATAIGTYNALYDSAKANKCVLSKSDEQLKENTNNLVRHVNFDQFPSEEKEELTTGSGRMPK